MLTSWKITHTHTHTHTHIFVLVCQFAKVQDYILILWIRCSLIRVNLKRIAFKSQDSGVKSNLPSFRQLTTTHSHNLKPKLQALVYDILPSTTAVFNYAIGQLTGSFSLVLKQ